MALARLRELIAAAPAPVVHYELLRYDDGTAAMQADAALARAEQAWQQVFEQSKPALTAPGTGMLPLIQARLMARNIRGEAEHYLPFVAR